MTSAKFIRLRRGAALIIALLLLAMGAVAQAAPPLPASFYGTAQVSGADAPAGAVVAAWIGDVKVAEAPVAVVDGRAVYTIDVLGDDPDTADVVEGGVEGDAITLTVDGAVATQTSAWTLGSYTRLDLTAFYDPAPPVAADQTLATDEDVPLPVTLTATDLNNDPLTFRVVDQPVNGTLSGTAPDLIYTPDANVHGTDSFTFVANDGTADSNLATVAITVNSVNDAPQMDAIADQVLDEGESRSLPITATDVEGDPIQLMWLDLPDFATLIDNGDGTGTLTLAPGYEDAGIYTDLTIVAFDGSAETRRSFAVTVVDAPPTPVAAFTVDRTRNVAQLSDGAGIVDYSSTYGYSNTPDKAIDPYPNSLWRSAGGQVTDQWIQVQLADEDTHVVDRVILKGNDHTDGMKDFEVSVSIDGVNFTPVLAGTVPQDDRLHQLRFPPVEARFVQLHVFNNWGNSSSIVVGHFQVWTRERNGGLVSLYEGLPATIAGVSSVYGSNAAERAIDGKGNTAWLAESAGSEWIDVELGSGTSHVVDRVRLRATDAAQAPNQFEIRVSTDGATFTTVFSGAGAATTEWQTFTFPAVEARIVHFFVHDNHGGARVQVNDFEVLTADGINAASSGHVGARVMEASAGSTYPNRAIDYDESKSSITYWGTKDAADQWIKVRLLGGKSYVIDRVQMQAPYASKAPRHFEIRVSNDGLADEDFQTVFAGVMPSDLEPHWFQFPPVTAKYVQLFVRDNHGGDSVQVSTFRVYATNQGGAVVPFRDRSTTPLGTIVGWEWDFGDGSISHEQHPIHTYAAPGRYPVRLTATNDRGISDTRTFTYEVLPPPLSDFTWGDATEGRNNFFYDASRPARGRIIGWQWRFPTETRSQQNPTNITLPDNGDWPVTLSVLDSRFMTASITKTVNAINLPPAVKVSAPGTVYWGAPWIPGALISESGPIDAESLVCDWDYGDGQRAQVTACTGATARVPYTYTTPGDYTVTLTVTDKDGGVDSAQANVTVQRHPTEIVNFGAVSLSSTRAQLQALLYDNVDFDTRIVDRTVTFQVESESGSQVVTGTTDADGIASAVVDALPGETLTVTTSFAGDTFYEPGAADEEVWRVAPTLPKGDIVFMIDESDSMQPDQEEVQARVTAIAEQLGFAVDYRLGLVGFGLRSSPGGQSRIVVPLTDNLDVFRDGVGQLKAAGETEPGFNAIAVGMSDAMGFRAGSGVCAVLIADEQATSNINPHAPETKEDALAALAARNAVFLGITGTSLAIRQDYGPDAGSIVDRNGGAVFDILDFRANPGPVLAAVIDHCVTNIYEEAAPDLQIDVTNGADVVAAGAPVTYTVTITNVSVREAFGVQITDTLPTGARFVEASDGGTASDGVVRWNLAELGPGATISRTVTVQIDTLPAGVTTITNTVAVGEDGTFGPEPNLADNRASDVDAAVGTVDLVLVKAADRTLALSGERLGYTLTVRNAGSRSVTGVVITETLPVGTAFDAAGSAAEWTADESGQRYSYAVDRLDAGAMITTIFAVRLDDQLPADLVEITNTATVGDDGRHEAESTPADNTATVTTTVASSNEPPVAVDDSAVTDEDVSVTIYVLGNDSDPDGDPLTLDRLGIPHHGVVVVGDASSVVYTPTQDVHGTDVFTYTVSDGELAATATVTVTIAPVNDAPLAQSQAITTAEDTAVDLTITGADVDGDSLTYRVATTPTHGALSGTAPDLVYTPAADYHGEDSFAFVASDGELDSDVATVTLVVEAVNDAPAAADDATTTDEDVPATIDVLSNDADVDGDSLTVMTVTQPLSGTAIISGSLILYTPDVDINGTDAFTYTVSDGELSDMATVTVTVRPVNDAPLAMDDQVMTDLNTVITIDVLSNDTDVEDDPLSLVAVGEPVTGTAAISDTQIVYTPDLDFVGTDSFTYTVSDDSGAQSVAVVVVSVELPPVVACELYPIALHTETLADANVDDVLADIYNGVDPGNFGWLTWSGNPNVPTLAANLTPPGHSDTYVNPNDPGDHLISVGDWVQGVPGVKNAKQIREALDNLLGASIIVPVWDEAEGQGNNARYRVSAYARVQLTGYDLSKENRISAQFLGTTYCGETELVTKMSGYEQSDPPQTKAEVAEQKMHLPLVFVESNAGRSQTDLPHRRLYLPAVSR